MIWVTIKVMVLVLVFRWWYGRGWIWVWHRATTERIKWLNEAFSISALARTWLSPFKQTYSKANKGSIDLRVQAVVDNFVSRLIGLLLRTIIIFVGLLGMGISLIFGLISVLIWPLIPLSPILAVILCIGGVGV